MKTVNIHEAKTHLSRLLESVVSGEEIIIAKNGQPIARLVAIKGGGKPRRPGALRGKVRVSEDFDAPLPPDLSDAFGVKR